MTDVWARAEHVRDGGRLKVKERLSGSGALVATEARRGWVVWLASWSVSGIAAVVSAERLAGIDQREY